MKEKNDEHFKRIFEYISSSSSADNAGYWIFARCKKCGEALKTRVDLDHDLSVDYYCEEDLSYLIRKTMVGGSSCFQRIEIELRLNHKRQLVYREKSGGNFMEGEEYMAGEVSSR